MSLNPPSVPGRPVYLNPANTDFVPGRWEPPVNLSASCGSVVLMFCLMVQAIVSGFSLQNPFAAFEANRELAGETVASQGEIVHCIPLPRGQIEIAYYYLVEGQRYSQSTTLGVKTCALHNAGAQVNIYYAKNNPASARLEGQYVDTFMPILSNVVVLSVLVGLAVTICGLFAQMSQSRRLHTQGQILDGELISCHEKTEYSRGRPKRYLELRYKLVNPSGKPLEGWTTSYDRDVLARRNLFSPGTPVKVLYADDKSFLML
jgi:hypothetical protein